MAKRIRRNGYYLGAFWLAFLVLYLLPFFVLRFTDVSRWSPSEMTRLMNYDFNMKHEDADVVIMGDSSALFGLDALQMSTALHARVVNLGNTLMSFPVVGEMELDHYLQNNRRPKVMVFYLAPWTLDYEHDAMPGLYEGEETLVRNGSPKQILQFSTHHVRAMLEFPFQFYAANRANYIVPILLRGNPPLTPYQLSGHRILPTLPALPQTCVLGKEQVAEAQRMQSAHRLLTKYAHAGDRVLMYVAPIPGCAGSEGVVAQPYREVSAKAPRRLPPAEFADDQSFSHPLEGTVSLVTQQLTDAVRPLLEGTDKP